MRPKTEIRLLSAPRAFEASRWEPAVDIYRRDCRWIVKFEVAGIRADEIEVSAQGRRLTIRGSRSDRAILEGARTYSMEIAYNKFERSIELPCELEHAEIRRLYLDGMLLVEITLTQQ